MCVHTPCSRSASYHGAPMYIYIYMRLFARVYVCVCAHIDPPERARIDNTGPERGTLRPFYEYRISGKQYSILEHPLGAAIFTA